MSAKYWNRLAHEREPWDCLMIAKRLADSAVPISLLADHPNVQFNYNRKGIGTCAVEMH